MSQINPVHTVPAISLRYTVLFSLLCLFLPDGLFPSDFHIKTLYAYIFFTIHFTCPAHLITVDLIALIIFDGKNNL